MSLAGAYRAHQRAIARVPVTKAALIAEILAERAAGKSWQKIADDISAEGLSRQRVYEIVNRRGDPK